MLNNCMNLDKSWYFHHEHPDKPTAAEGIIKDVAKCIRRRKRWFLVRFYAVPVLIGYVAIDALKRKVYEAEAKRGRPFGYNYRVYKGRGR